MTSKRLRASGLLLISLILTDCSRDEAIERLKHDLPIDGIQIVHARFPCRSPDMHFFGYRFRARSNGEYGNGDICLNLSTKEWTWHLLPNSPLAHLNQTK